MNCINCGTKCKELKVLPKYYTWEHRYFCPLCNSKFREIVGDAMGGSRDTLTQVDDWGPEYSIFDKLGEKLNESN